MYLDWPLIGSAFFYTYISKGSKDCQIELKIEYNIFGQTITVYIMNSILNAIVSEIDENAETYVWHL